MTRMRVARNPLQDLNACFSRLLTYFALDAGCRKVKIESALTVQDMQMVSKATCFG